MTNELLKVDIQKRLKEFDLDVDFELKKGCLGILGPSGCGKSMTLKSIAGIVDPDDGIVSLNGKTYFDSSAKINLKPQKRNVGLRTARLDATSMFTLLKRKQVNGRCRCWSS